jgi:fused signal recognition particle receptor
MAEAKRGIFQRVFGGGAKPHPPAEHLEPQPEGATRVPPLTDAAEPDPGAPAQAGATEATAEPAPARPAERGNWFQRLRQGLSRSSNALGEGISSVFTKRKLDAATLEEFEDVLIRADLGVDTATRIGEALRQGRFNRDISDEEVKAVLAAEVEKVLAPVAQPLLIDPKAKPHVVLVVGVNGTGKTTTIGKLASKSAKAGLKVVLAAGDTFRAAAIDQLRIWGQRTGATVVAREAGADSAGLAHDALSRAKAEGADLLLIDTAGRLQNKAELMAELEKVIRVIRKLEPGAPHSVLLVLDATTGQNALQQVEVFGQKTGVTGLAMTKLDGTARGGILVAIAAKYKLPVHFIGVGEQADDLEPFAAKDFARAIAGL